MTELYFKTKDGKQVVKCDAQNFCVIDFEGQRFDTSEKIAREIRAGNLLVSTPEEYGDAHKELRRQIRGNKKTVKKDD